MDPAHVRESLQNVHKRMFDANLTLNELQIYMETSANDQTALEQENKQQKTIIDTQTQEIARLKKIVVKLQSQQAAIRRLLYDDSDSTSTIVINHDEVSDGSVFSESEDVFSESESESSVLSFDPITSPYFSQPPPKRRAVQEVEGYFCEKCDNMAFSTRCSYDRHVRTMHERKFRFPCNHCNAGFEMASRLTAHQQRVHGIKHVI